MATRIKDWEVPYTWGIGIEITNNHVINVLLRELNNLIHVTDDRELYVDLQLDDWIQPDDDFPVGVTTGKILQEDWRDQNGIILNWKTTSGDYVRLIYANDWKLYYDPWTWQWIEIATGGSLPWVATESTLWLVKLWSDTVQTEAVQTPTATSGRSYAVQLNSSNQASVNVPWTDTTYQSLAENQWGTDESLVTTWEKYLWNHKQDAVTAGTGITINNNVISAIPYTAGTRITIDANNVISADISWALVYKWNVADASWLPSSWNTVWDCWFNEDDSIMYAWDWTQWNAVGSVSPNLNNYFNKTVDDSDDITEGTTNLFVSQTEKNYRNGKQDALTAGDNISINGTVISATYTAGNNVTITNWVISATDTNTTYTAWNWLTLSGTEFSNDAPFEPANSGSMWQYLKKTNSWYQWADVPSGSWTTYTAGDGISISSSNVISNDAPFDPTNTATTWYVLKASGRNSYYRAPESWWSGWFSPENTGTEWQVLTKTDTGYRWSSSSAEQEVRVWNIPTAWFSQDEMQEIVLWCLDSGDYGRSAILKDDSTSGNKNMYIYWYHNTVSGVSNYYFYWMWEKQEKNTSSANGDFTTKYNTLYRISYDGSTFTGTRQDTVEVAWNYLTVEDSWYTRPYMPTEAYQPATKQYVDQVAAGSISVWAITNNTTGTTSTIQQERAGTQSEYDALTSINPNTIYNIIDS